MTEIAATKPDDVGLSASRLARLEPWMRSQIDSGRLAGIEVMINRRGRTAFHHCTGKRDLARGTNATPDTIYRVYSMTKALTSVAVMMLYEEGRFQLDDPVSKVLPAFSNMRVFTGGGYGSVITVPAVRDITYRDLLTHTSGLTYGFMQAGPVDAAYRAQGIELPGTEKSLAEMMNLLAAQPLIAQPGAEWNYSHATDVLGHLVAAMSGQPFDQFLRERVIAPLGMTDTDFVVPAAKVNRFAANYMRGEDGRPKLIDDPEKSRYLAPPKAPSGGGGLVSTARDYMRFCQMLLGKGALVLSVCSAARPSN